MRSSSFAHSPRRAKQQFAHRAKSLESSARGVIERLESRTLLTAILSPVADTFIRNNAYVNTNYGASPVLYVENGSAGSDSRTALLTFDLTGISAVTSATLQIDASLEYPDSAPADLGVYPVASSSWTEGSGTIDSRNGNGTTTNSSPAGPITWNNAPTVSTSPIVASPESVNRFGMETYSFDLTSYVNSLPAGTTTVSMALAEPTQSSQWVQVLSRESGQFGPQLVVNGAGASSVPVATVTAPDVTDPSVATIPVSVLYTSDAAIDQSTITMGNITVSSPAGTLSIVDASIAQSSTPNAVTAMYDIAAPTGGWVPLDNGLYTITVQPDQVAVGGGGTAPISQGQFRVAVNDTSPPTAVINAASVTSPGASSYQFSITFTDDVAVDTSWADVDNVQVLGPQNQLLTVTSAAVDISANGTPRTITYTVTAPSGQWSSNDNGTYTINLLGGQVRDTAGNAAAAQSGQFAVNIPIPDTTPPNATITAPSINSPGGTNEVVTVTYTDNVAVDVSTINVGNIVVRGPQGPLTVSAAQVSGGNGTPVTVNYTVAAPGGSWDGSDNGVYSVTVVAGSVKDTSGNGVVTATGEFAVTATLPDTTPPSAQISAPDVTSAGTASATITVIFADNVAVNAASISTANITVTGSSGALAVTSATPSGGNGSPLTVTYVVAAPHGTWGSADNGSYTIALNPNQVSDTSGNFAGGASGSFSVNIPVPNPGPMDSTFNSGQAVDTNFVTEAIVSQPDGRLLAVGRQGDMSTGSSRGVIERFNSDGTLDTSFGNQGVIVGPAGANEAYFAVTMQDATHFLVAGTSGGDFLLERFDLSGNLDSSFATSGRTTIDFGTTTDTARSIALAPGGLIVLGGDSGGNFAFARLDANGHLDPNFAQSGRQLFGVGNGTDNGLSSIVVQPGGAILAVGSEGASVVVVHLTAAGEADGGFGNGGLVAIGQLSARTDLGSPDRSEGLALQSNGDILVANRTPSGHFGLVRLNPSGTVDTTFGTNGLVTANFGGDDDADSVIVQNSGPIILVGTSLQASTAFTAVAAFDPSGNPLTNFGNQGLLTLPGGVPVVVPATKRPGGKALHVGDIVLRAFGTVTSDGRVVIGTSNEAVSATTSSTLRRLIVPGALSTGRDAGSLVGTFSAKVHKIVSHGVTFVMTGGTGHVFFDASTGRFTIDGDDLGKGINLTISGKNVSLADVTISGTLRTLNARKADLHGTLHVTGAIGKLMIGNISDNVWSGSNIGTVTAGDMSGSFFATGALGKLKFGNISGTIASGSGVIGALNASTLANARILSGTNLGADGQVGGNGADQDTYAAGSIGTIKVKGAITTSFVGAGVNPVDSTFGNSDDKLAAGSVSSIIHLISAKSADSASRFESGAFGKALLPKLITIAGDARFKVLT